MEGIKYIKLGPQNQNSYVKQLEHFHYYISLYFGSFVYIMWFVKNNLIRNLFCLYIVFFSLNGLVLQPRQEVINNT